MLKWQVSATHTEMHLSAVLWTQAHTFGSAWLRDIGLVVPVFLSASWHPLRHLCKTEWQSFFLPAFTHTHTFVAWAGLSSVQKQSAYLPLRFEKIKKCNLGLLFSWIKGKLMSVPRLTPRPMWWLSMSACLFALPVCLSNCLPAYYSYSTNRYSQLGSALASIQTTKVYTIQGEGAVNPFLMPHIKCPYYLIDNTEITCFWDRPRLSKTWRNLSVSIININSMWPPH